MTQKKHLNSNEIFKEVTWQSELLDAVKLSKDAIQELPLTKEEIETVERLKNKFPLLLTKKYIDLIDWDNQHDPMRKLLIPSELEMLDEGEFDTSGEAESTVAMGLQHKYSQTAVIILIQACAAHCRYCFRRRLLTRDMLIRESISDLEPALDYIKSHPEIDNVLLSGGDPLLNNTKRLEKLFNACAGIPHVKTIRISTKIPAFLPRRILEKSLLELLKSYKNRFQFIFQCHFDHPSEITEDTKEALSALEQLGCMLTSQVVLMRGINDKVDVLVSLYKELHRLNITPQYLFHPRPVKHATHFQIPIAEGIKLVDEVKSLCSGPIKRFRYVIAMNDGKAELVGKVNKDNNEYLVLKWIQQRMGKNTSSCTELIKIKDSDVWLSE